MRSDWDPSWGERRAENGPRVKPLSVPELLVIRAALLGWLSDPEVDNEPLTATALSTALEKIEQRLEERES